MRGASGWAQPGSTAEPEDEARSLFSNAQFQPVPIEFSSQFPVNVLGKHPLARQVRQPGLSYVEKVTLHPGELPLFEFLPDWIRRP